jgi:hypothetical protein
VTRSFIHKSKGSNSMEQELSIVTDEKKILDEVRSDQDIVNVK